MKADLYGAHARTAGTAGLAHRTAAGFVVLTSADGDDMIVLIEGKQDEPDLIDQVVAMAYANGPAAFAMLFTAGGESYVIASGAARIALASDSIQLTMQPVGDQVLVHSLSAGINESVATVRLHLDDIADEASSDLDLAAGTVEATWVEIAIGGAVLGGASSADAEPAEVPAPSEPAAIVPETTDEPAPAEPAAIVPETTDEPAPAAVSIPFASDEPALLTQPVKAEPEPATTRAAAAAAAVPTPSVPAAKVGSVMVLGVNCSQGHHNHPDAVYCSQCGTKMGVHHTTVLINGPRPPLGVLVVDDGTTYSLNEDLVIGREPTSHQDVRAGTASPMILTDDTLSLSRKHARIVLDDWSVAVQDLSSSNGTYLSRAGQSENWAKIDSGATMALEPGDRLRVGGRIIQVELHHIR